MNLSPRKSLGFWALGFIVLIFAVGALYFLRAPPEEVVPSEVVEPDLDDERKAARTRLLTGTAKMRPLTSLEMRDEIFPAPPNQGGQAATLGSWLSATKDSAFFLETLFYLPEKSSLKMMTTGSWTILLDGEGMFVFEDARKNAQGTKRAVSWYVKKGSFRAKPLTVDGALHWLVLRTPHARLLVKQGEVGVRVNDDGGGQAWLMEGEKAVLYRSTGERVELEPKGVASL